MLPPQAQLRGCISWLDALIDTENLERVYVSNKSRLTNMTEEQYWGYLFFFDTFFL